MGTHDNLFKHIEFFIAQDNDPYEVIDNVSLKSYGKYEIIKVARFIDKRLNHNAIISFCVYMSTH
jgi:hypothetical protein